MNGKISVVINTLNEEKYIEQVLKSVQFADEILVCDMQSDDDTALKARRLGATVIFHRRLNFVEPARNFAISKASHEWVLVVDPDEEVPASLAEKLKELAANDSVLTHVEIPRKNIIFGKWVKASMWWPDYNIRFFRNGQVVWSDRIHIPPKAIGQGLKLATEESLAIIHHHYESISEYLTRMNRYSDVQSDELVKDGYKFDWADLIKKPLNEFLGRYFANRGFEDGLHGLALSLLQAFSFLVVYLKVWENQGFGEQSIGVSQLQQQSKESARELDYWFKYGNLSKNPLKAFLQRAKNRLSLPTDKTKE